MSVMQRKSALRKRHKPSEKDKDNKKYKKIIYKFFITFDEFTDRVYAAQTAKLPDNIYNTFQLILKQDNKNIRTYSNSLLSMCIICEFSKFAFFSQFLTDAASTNSNITNFQRALIFLDFFEKKLPSHRLSIGVAYQYLIENVPNINNILNINCIPKDGFIVDGWLMRQKMNHHFLILFLECYLPNDIVLIIMRNFNNLYMLDHHNYTQFKNATYIFD